MMHDTLTKPTTTYEATVGTNDDGHLEVLVTRNIHAGICGPFDQREIETLRDVAQVLTVMGFELDPDADWKLAGNGFFYTSVVLAPRGRPAAEMDW